VDIALGDCQGQSQSAIAISNVNTKSITWCTL